MKCRECKREVPEGNLFCEYCGTRVEHEETMCFCPYCGSKNSSEASFCESCGAKLTNNHTDKIEKTNIQEELHFDNKVHHEHRGNVPKFEKKTFNSKIIIGIIAVTVVVLLAVVSIFVIRSQNESPIRNEDDLSEISDIIESDAFNEMLEETEFSDESIFNGTLFEESTQEEPEQDETTPKEPQHATFENGGMELLTIYGFENNTCLMELYVYALSSWAGRNPAVFSCSWTTEIIIEDYSTILENDASKEITYAREKQGKPLNNDVDTRGIAIYLPDNPDIAGEQWVTLTYGTNSVTVCFTLTYKGDFSSDNGGWSISAIRFDEHVMVNEGEEDTVFEEIDDSIHGAVEYQNAIGLKPGSEYNVSFDGDSKVAWFKFTTATNYSIHRVSIQNDYIDAPVSLDLYEGTIMHSVEDCKLGYMSFIDIETMPNSDFFIKISLPDGYEEDSKKLILGIQEMVCDAGAGKEDSFVIELDTQYTKTMNAFIEDWFTFKTSSNDSTYDFYFRNNSVSDELLFKVHDEYGSEIKNVSCYEEGSDTFELQLNADSWYYLSVYRYNWEFDGEYQFSITELIPEHNKLIREQENKASYVENETTPTQKSSQEENENQEITNVELEKLYTNKTNKDSPVYYKLKTDMHPFVYKFFMENLIREVGVKLTIYDGYGAVIDSLSIEKNSKTVSVELENRLVSDTEYIIEIVAQSDSDSDAKYNFSVSKTEARSDELLFIDIDTEPYKCIYNVGEVFSLEGLSLLAIYDDNSVEFVSSGYTCIYEDGMILENPGVHYVTVYYQGKETSFVIEVH